MIRKRTAIFFILLANIILLVHAVVPHHHHESLVCIESSHCQSNCYDHNHNTCSNDHEHDGSSDTECCVLKQAVVVPVNTLRQEFKCLGCDNNHFPFVHFLTILFSTEFNPFVPKVISITQIPIKITSYSSFYYTSLGLRAPPIV